MRNIFYIHRNDRRIMALSIVVLLAAACVVLLVGKGGDGASVATPDSVGMAAKDRYIYVGESTSHVCYSVEGRQTELFPFDPNTADSTALLRLGLQEWQVRSVYKYRSHGGIYRTKEDFARLYGLTAGQYRELEPYIRISDDCRPAAEMVATGHKNLHVRDTVKYPLKLHPGEHVALNTADTTTLMRVPGIGPAFAKAITAYRERLGGYYSTEQLKEINGFPLAAMPYFVVNGEPLRTLDLNEMTLSQLRRHPYIGFYQAKTIVEHRRLHGRIQSLNDLRLYRDFTPEVIERLRHYVK